MTMDRLFLYGRALPSAAVRDPVLRLSQRTSEESALRRLFQHFGEDESRTGVWLVAGQKRRHFRRQDLYRFVQESTKGLADIAAPTEARPLRYLNLLLRQPGSGTVLARERMEPDSTYQVRLWIGAHAPESIISNAPAFPDAALPRDSDEHELDIAAHSNDVKITSPVRKLLLPRAGDSGRVSIGFRTPSRPGRGTIRVVVWHRRHVLQSALIEMSWGQLRRGRRSHSALIDYTASNLTELDALPSRDLCLVTNDSAAGVHRLIVNGSEVKPYAVTLTEADMSGRLNAARAALLDAHRDPQSGKTTLGKNNEKGYDAFVADLTELAHAGAGLLEIAFRDARRRNAIVRGLRAAAAEKDGRAVIQVAQAAGSRLLFPWHLVYDIGFEVFSHGGERPCRILDAWTPSASRDHLPRRCPYEAEHTLNTVCPYGFWGPAHLVEQPPSTADPADTLPFCVSHGPPAAPMAVALSRRLNKKMTGAHLDALPTGLSVERLSTVDKLKRALGVPERELIYFYCHGRREYTNAYREVTSLLEIGDEEFIATGDISAWASIEGGWPDNHWTNTRPLVVINGCHTIEASPIQPADFVSAFMGAGAAGVIGTEVMLDQPLAGEAAETFLRELLSGDGTVGDALREMRWQLLAKGNVMGLAYTPFCSADLTLSCN